MWKNFLKRSGWTDIVISLIFILFGAMLIARPESIMSIVAILLGLIFIVSKIFIANATTFFLKSVVIFSFYIFDFIYFKIYFYVCQLCC